MTSLRHPSDIIAITVRRYIEPPADKEFWSEYIKMNIVTPSQMVALLSRYIDMQFIENRPLIKGDYLFVNYIKALNPEVDSST